MEKCPLCCGFPGDGTPHKQRTSSLPCPATVGKKDLELYTSSALEYQQAYGGSAHNESADPSQRLHARCIDTVAHYLSIAG
jgi:hypothetical protein